MITIQNPLTFTSSYPPKRLGAISDLLFFDIETTGFSGDYASVYLIGCVWHDGNTWILTSILPRRGMRRKRFSTLFSHFSRQSASSSISTAMGLTFHF